MIKYMGERDGRTILGLMISESNIDLLKKGMPIHINCEEMNLPEFKFKELTIIYFKTENLARQYLKDSGMVTKETAIVKEKRVQ